MKIYFVSLGCDKNTVDSEMMLGMINGAGVEITMSLDDADGVIINSCAFIADAKEESINTILEMAKLKQEGRLKKIIVTGCLAQRYKDEIIREIPEVDAVVGIQSFDKIVGILFSDDKEPRVVTDDLNLAPISGHKRLLTTSTHYAYMKIAEGCDKHCTYCIIPKLRGRFRSVPMDTLLNEAKDLAKRGIKELILVAQETTLYGVDISGRKQLPELLRELAKVDGIERIRLLYTYPEEINDELIEVIKSEPKVCHYIDMPIQHASDRILKRMGRRTTNADLRNIIMKLRCEIPDIVLRTTLITGFPGERLSDYRILKDFVRDIGFDRLGVFTYSREEGTPAATMKGQLPEAVKKFRRNGIMKLQQRIVYAKNEAMVGRELTVCVDGRLVEDGVYVTRSYMDAPDVDGIVFVATDREMMCGDSLNVRISAADGYDLVAEEV